MNDPLSPLERRVYHYYLIDYLAEHTYQPSVRDASQAVPDQVHQERGRDHRAR
ncbi:MAG: hypothetical protein U0163_10940 [Gemmatimonadaceae bacterium]